MERTEKGPFLEVRVVVPPLALEAVMAWLWDRGALGVQEDWPGLSDEGPVLSGDPREFSGAELTAPKDKIEIISFFEDIEQRDALCAGLNDLLQDISQWCPGAAEATCKTRLLAGKDWVAMSRAHFTPTPIGRGLMVCPPWERPPEGREVIWIAPGMAFGTGTHFTTAACLVLLEEALASREAARVLDVGTGSGILAIAALKLGAQVALGVDVDGDALEEALANAAQNGVLDRFTVSKALPDPLAGPFDIVLANILAETVVEMAFALRKLLAPGGDLIVSGIIHERAEWVAAAMADLGFAPVRELRDSAWVATWYR